jgi:hypothetical protein
MPRDIETLSAHKGRPATYAWDDWMDGNPRAFVRGTKDEVKEGIADFSAKTLSFENQVRKVAGLRGLSVTIRRPDETTVEFQTLGPVKVKEPEASTPDIPSA